MFLGPFGSGTGGGAVHPTSMVLVGLAAAATARPRGRQQCLKPAMPPPAACAPPKVKVVGKPPLKRQDEKFLMAVRAIRGAQDETRKTLKQLRSWKKNEGRWWVQMGCCRTGQGEPGPGLGRPGGARPAGWQKVL